MHNVGKLAWDSRIAAYSYIDYGIPMCKEPRTLCEIMLIQTIDCCNKGQIFYNEVENWVNFICIDDNYFEGPLIEV